MPYRGNRHVQTGSQTPEGLSADYSLRGGNGNAGARYADILQVYATASQLRSEATLSYSNPPAGVRIPLKGLKANADGLYSLSDVYARLSKAIDAYDTL